MKYKYYQSEAGNITLVNMGDQVAIRLFSRHNKTGVAEYFLVMNPDSKPVFSDNIKEVELNGSMTPQEAFDKIDIIEGRKGAPYIPG